MISQIAKNGHTMPTPFANGLYMHPPYIEQCDTPVPRIDVAAISSKLQSMQRRLSDMRYADALIQSGNYEALRLLGYEDESIAKLTAAGGYAKQKYGQVVDSIARLKSAYMPELAAFEEVAQDNVGYHYFENPLTAQCGFKFSVAVPVSLADVLHRNGFYFDHFQMAWVRVLSKNAQISANNIMKISIKKLLK